MGCTQSNENEGRPPIAAAYKYSERMPSFLTACANAYEQHFVAFVVAHCELGVGMFCPFNEIVAALMSAAPIPELNVPNSVIVVEILLRRYGVKLRGIQSRGQLSEYMYCVGMRLKSFPPS